MRRLFLASTACLALALPLHAEPAMPQLTVTGEGQAAAAPDMATVSLGVTSQNAEAGAAMEAASGVATAILARLEALGIEPRDRQTSDISLQPVWTDYNAGERRITGYEARNELTVRVRDLAQLGDVLAAVTEDGANALSGLSFGVQDPGPLLDAARRDAVADAMARAKVLAEAAGLELGPVVSITEEGGSMIPMAKMEMARVSSVPVAAGETVLSARVGMVFELTQ